ncbi:hypothetical protein SAMN02799631_03916 [Methylobacterium sp. 174MFSha1.1]|uniref:hypothetical protein n=1 Tax=Methylobacterium sp. 174MFSha1.1 TaxID=1502749 RepID=UPI0008E9C7C3|nr:hypothetical protein [Methylobacterium sp. 174MFSha1.1]SFV02323.1 hypothetical protein SAMN02799631_03916 [Methylobacterium sp. 174MFSha1.1]
MRPGALTDLRRIAGLAGLACLPVLVWLSWIPKDWELRTGAAGQLEHLVAYAGTAGLLGLGFPRRPVWRLALALVLLAGLLEIGQIWVPGRTAQVVDFAASAGGALLGLAAARTLAGRWIAAGQDSLRQNPLQKAL